MKKKDKKKTKIFKKKIEPKSRIKISKFKKKDSFSTMDVVIVMFLSLIIGFVLAMLFNYAKDKYYNYDNNLDEIITTYNSILENYYDEVNPDELSEAAVSGMVNSLDDPNSYYMDKETSKTFNESLEGTYKGIGLVISRVDQDVVIVKVIKDSPADKAGIKKDDILVRVNDSETSELAVNQIADLIKKTDNVKVTYKRGDKENTVNLKKTKLDLESVTYKKYDNTGYIYISTFASNTAKQFNDSLKKLEKDNIKSLIIDVRSNPGGHLEQADKILYNFFNKDTVLYQIEEKGNKVNVIDKTKDSRNYPVVILINGTSASASEIIASCFKDNYQKGVIVGNESFGKGTIQNEVILKNGGSYKYTMKKWLSSKGTWYDRDTTGGIKPDVEVTNDIQSTDDKQLDKALELLKKEE